MTSCPNCGASLSPDQSRCRKCGTTIQQPPSSVPSTAAQQPVQVIIQAAGASTPVVTPDTQAPPVGMAVKSKVAAGLLGIFLGALGVHRFYLGYIVIGVAQLLLTVLGFWACGIGPIAAGIWGLVEGIMILAGSIDRDAKGRPLAE